MIFFWGASVHHLARPNESIVEGDQKGNVPMKVTVHVGARSRKLHHGLLSREYTISPNILYQHQGSFNPHCSQTRIKSVKSVNKAISY